jgi:hypothetical protein
MSERPSVRIGTGASLTLERGEVGIVHGDRSDLWSLDISVVDEGLTAQTSIWLGPEGVEEPLADFFADLADDWRGWSGTKVWNGMEGGLRLSCTHDKVGHITMRVSLSRHSGTGWETHVDVPLEAGQLDHVATEMRRLLAT